MNFEAMLESIEEEASATSWCHDNIPGYDAMSTTAYDDFYTAAHEIMKISYNEGERIGRMLLAMELDDKNEGWFVLDCNKNHVHIGDYVKIFNDIYKVEALGEDTIIYIDEPGGWMAYPSFDAEKVEYRKEFEILNELIKYSKASHETELYSSVRKKIENLMEEYKRCILLEK